MSYEWRMPMMSRWFFPDGSPYLCGTGNIWWIRSYHESAN